MHRLLELFNSRGSWSSGITLKLGHSIIFQHDKIQILHSVSNNDIRSSEMGISAWIHKYLTSIVYFRYRSTATEIFTNWENYWRPPETFRWSATFFPSLWKRKNTMILFHVEVNKLYAARKRKIDTTTSDINARKWVYPIKTAAGCGTYPFCDVWTQKRVTDGCPGH